MEHILYIRKGGIDDLGDLLHIARSKGKKRLKCERVHIKPEIAYLPDGYVLIVSELNGKEKPDVERKKHDSNEKPIS